MFYWVFGYSEEGKRALLGPYPTEEKAAEVADLLTDAEIYPLETRNQQKATKIVKAKLIQEGVNVDEAFQRQSHVKPSSRYTRFAEPKEDIFSGNPFQD